MPRPRFRRRQAGLHLAQELQIYAGFIISFFLIGESNIQYNSPFDKNCHNCVVIINRNLICFLIVIVATMQYHILPRDGNTSIKRSGYSDIVEGQLMEMRDPITGRTIPIKCLCPMDVHTY